MRAWVWLGEGRVFWNGINATGQIVGEYRNISGTYGFLLSGVTYPPLNHPLADGTTIAKGINGAGQIVGYYSDSNGRTHGFLYELNSATYTAILDDPLAGSRGTFVTGINDVGQIVGYYYDSSFNIHGFRFTLTITPNPPPRRAPRQRI